MRIRIPRERLRQVITYLEIVKDDEKQKNGLILDSRIGHFEHVIKRLYCKECGNIQPVNTIICPNCDSAVHVTYGYFTRAQIRKGNMHR